MSDNPSVNKNKRLGSILEAVAGLGEALAQAKKTATEQGKDSKESMQSIVQQKMMEVGLGMLEDKVTDPQMKAQVEGLRANIEDFGKAKHLLEKLMGKGSDEDKIKHVQDALIKEFKDPKSKIFTSVLSDAAREDISEKFPEISKMLLLAQNALKEMEKDPSSQACKDAVERYIQLAPALIGGLKKETLAEMYAMPVFGSLLKSNILLNPTFKEFASTFVAQLQNPALAAAPRKREDLEKEGWPKERIDNLLHAQKIAELGKELGADSFVAKFLNKKMSVGPHVAKYIGDSCYPVAMAALAGVGSLTTAGTAIGLGAALGPLVFGGAAVFCAIVKGRDAWNNDKALKVAQAGAAIAEAQLAAQQDLGVKQGPPPVRLSVSAPAPTVAKSPDPYPVKPKSQQKKSLTFSRYLKDKKSQPLDKYHKENKKKKKGAKKK